MKATKGRLDSLKGDGTRHDYSIDGTPGLKLRVSRDGGNKAWVYRFKRGRRYERVTIGTYPAVGIAEAASLAAAMRGAALAGDDPRDLLPDARPLGRQVDRVTVADLADEFRDRHLKAHVKTWRETWRMLEKDVLPAWGSRGVQSITSRDVVLLLDAIVDRGALRIANRVRSVLFQMFRFAVGRGLVENSPVVAVPAPAKSTGGRTRILDHHEIRTFWRAIDGLRVLQRLQPALRLLLITGQRRGEVTGARWSEFDLDAATWTIPGERTKAGRQHVVPLSPMARDVLVDLRAMLADADRADSPFLFPSPHSEKDAPVDAKALTRAVSRNRDAFQLAPFTIHDLRRTVRSNLAAMGIDAVVARKVVNHSLDGMDGIYNHHDYADEKRAALDAWADMLADIIAGEPSKVMAIGRARS